MFRFITSTFKTYKKAKFEKERYVENYFLNSNNEFVVDIKLDNVNDAYSQYSLVGVKALDPSLTEYIDGVIYNLPLKNPVVLNFNVENISAKEKVELKEVVKNHYGLVLEDKTQDLKINFATILSLFIIGTVLLLFSYFLASNGNGQLVTDIINIAGTFSLWEMVDLYILDRKVRKVEKMNAAQTYTSMIIFNNN